MFLTTTTTRSTEHFNSHKMTEEQITIQIGSFSNYVGSHFWNFQDDIFAYCTNENEDPNEVTHEKDSKDEDRSFCQFSQLFRSGKINGKEMSTPRAIIIDRRGTLGSLNPMAAFDTPETSSSATQPAIDTWDRSKTSIFREDVKEKNAFLRMLEKQDNYYEDAQNITYDKYGRIIEQEDNNDEEQLKEDENEKRENQKDGRGDGDRLQDSDVNAWSDFLKVHLHPSSVIELPFWSINEPFSTYAAGMSRSVLSDDNRGDYFDKIRKFAEECDYLRNITVLSDLHDGFGGLTCALMEEIRDEFPRMTVPVWGFTESDESAICTLQQELEKESVGSLVLPLYNVPLCYASLAETASVLLPINPQAAQESSPLMKPTPYTPYHSAAVVASAIELATGYQRIQNSRQSTCQASNNVGGWIQNVTCKGQFKFCNVEMKLPFPLDLSMQETGDSSLSISMSSLWATYDDSSRPATSYSMNPFMKSLSASVYGQWSADPAFLRRERATKPYSNVLTIRGSRSEGLPGDFFRHCRGTKYPVSEVHQRRLGLPIPNSFPSIFHEMNSNGLFTPPQGDTQAAHAAAQVLFPPAHVSLKDSGTEDTLPARYLNGMASVGCDGATMGHHLANVRESWAIRPYKALLQLEQVGMSRDDCKEVEETLLQLEESYAV